MSDFKMTSRLDPSSSPDPPPSLQPLRSTKPTHIAENEEGDIALEGRNEVPSSDTQPRAENDDVKQSTFQHTNGRDPQLIHVEDVNERSGPSLDAFCTATFRPKTGVGDGTGVMVSGTSASMAGTTLMAGSPNVMPSIEPMTPERTPSPIGLRGATPPRQPDDCERGCLDLLDQAVDDFVHDSHEQIRQFSSRGNSRETYKALFDSLGNEANETGEERTRWSDGSEWVSLLEAGHGERHKGTICYALTAIAFARWHTSQVRLVDGATTAQKAAQEVSARILGPKPEDDENNRKEWERRRKRLGTHLTRGRKWSRLVEELGSGILLKNAWQLAKSPELALETLVKGLPGSPEKATVLRLLADQMTLLMETGRTNPDKFRYDLKSEGLPFSDPCSSTGCVELDGLYEQVRDSITGDMLLVKGTDFRFGVDSLLRLGGTRWLNDEVILACLHLSDKLAFVRVGFSIPIHRQTRSHSTIPRPFERAAKQMAEWHHQAEARSRLVCFFPLFQHQNHFSLLEINEREGSIFHYDPMGEGENADVKAACEKEFPHFRYVEEGALRQDDGHSCGPLVIRHARCRMLGRPVVSGGVDKYDAREVRAEAVRLLCSAWTSNGLVAAPQPPRRKRKAGAGEKNCPGGEGKRRKVSSGK